MAAEAAASLALLRAACTRLLEGADCAARKTTPAWTTHTCSAHCRVAATVLQVDWLTPVEVFAPWYGRALGHFMLELRKHDSSIDSSSPLSIIEIGGGTGTLAASILVSSTAAAVGSLLVLPCASLLARHTAHACMHAYISTCLPAC